MPAASTILMIRPAAFGYNDETAANNFFQHHPDISREAVQQKALAEFDAMVALLRRNEVEVLVLEDSKEPPKPDAVFPNNWISTSPDGRIMLYPLYAANRRTEKREEIVQQLARDFVVTDVQDWTEFEVEGRFLEGTGSMVIDHDHEMIYAAISERTNLSVLEKFSSANKFQAIVFLATDRNGQPVYHTNVVMTLGEKFAVLCEEAIEEEWELIAVKQLLESTGHAIIPITREQMHCFAGNMLELKNRKDEPLLVLSQSAFESLRADQLQELENYVKLLPVAVPTIEQVEGGSVRCMMAEIFLKRK
ncbi:MAG: amidinotransferase [Sphingobacteriales bacterium]|nr:amidinotransferase [Sphingobacteriales bacterium]